MNMLIDLIPKSVEVAGINLEINSNFRESILFELLMQDKEKPDEQKFEEALALYYPLSSLKEIKQRKIETYAVEALLDFYVSGKKKSSAKPTEDDEEGKEEISYKPPIYSFEFDDQYIYSAFLDQYGIDLQDIEYLHWWKFKALFFGLSEDCLMSKIMGYRAMDVPQDMPESQKEFYRKMKKIYALPDLRTEEEKEQAFSESLLF